MNQIVKSIQMQSLGLQPYEVVLEKMQSFTANRDEKTNDQLWLVEHEKVFTQGRHGKGEHILSTSDIPIVQTDRGGQVTYHGPGQAIIYFMIDLKRIKIGIKNLVCLIEKSAIEMLKTFAIESHLQDNAPGVYVNDQKICSLGLRVKQGRTYHGLSINVDMDLSPFKLINPCGYKNLQMTQIKQFKSDITLDEVYNVYTTIFSEKFNTAVKAKAGTMGVDACLS
ncbi:lipoyl(octanoyl) transferase LipB [Thiotrichales bacterium 19S3-7]|nr:lipoyl(octanoyl) transferase LipB [Thiotrichales bacterium 19S3-7]MCF6801918.1 lipoyl(octanoyl) transferase LipB [Thiotrichales bacterium 19S3-11]